MPRLFLVGYRATGKTTVGRLVAKQLGCEFVDADIYLEAACDKTVRELFCDEGEAGFRDRESAVIAELATADIWGSHVVSTGGGVARAVAHGLHKEGAAVSIASRGLERATALAAEVGCKVIDWQARHSMLPCDIVVNCTPVGMTPNTDESPLHVSFLKEGLTVFDTVYTPENTLLIREARDRGCLILTGVDLFVRQAARQVELLTGITPDLDKMREVLRKAMSPLTKALDAPEAE